MTPKEKAEEIFNKMYEELPARLGRYEESKNCTLIAVDEILVMIGGQWKLHAQRNFWTEVKKEIEKI